MEPFSHIQRLDRALRLEHPFGALRTTRDAFRLPAPVSARESRQGQVTLFKSLDEIFDFFAVSDGAILSFHHHFRNGDRVLQFVIDFAATRGLKDLTIAASSLFPNHAALVPHIKNGVIKHIITDYMAGPLADAIIHHELDGTVLLQSHGGRARAITSGELSIDVAFIGASLADDTGAATGRGGHVACGPLGYAMVDAAYAKATIVLAHEISATKLEKVDIPSAHVDGLMPFEFPGQADGIAFGSTIPLDTQPAHQIGTQVVDVITASGLFTPQFSFQTGAGGYSLACVPHINKALKQKSLQARFISGGITGAHVDLIAQGQAQCIKDVQCFDQKAALSSSTNAWHHPMSAAEYASPIFEQSAASDLSVMILGAAEIDRQFNINVAVGGNGRLIGGPGGHPDTAAGAQLTIVTTRLNAGGYAKIVDEVACICTPGTDVDVLVTDQGVAVNPAKPALAHRLSDSGIELTSIDALITQSHKQAEKQKTMNIGAPCALVEAPDGRIIDVILGR